MSLVDLAASDFESIARNTNEWGRSIILQNPSGETVKITGITGDISEVVDPDTGQLVQGRRVHIRIPLSDLTVAGFQIPENIPDTGEKPWLVRFFDTQKVEYLFRVVQPLPDRTLGSITLILEVYVYRE